MNIYNIYDELSIVARWFYTIDKLADERKNANGVVMSDADTLQEIKNKAKIAAEYVENYLLIEKPDV
jgi:putative N-acetylmannosamine-6-phosphate epimerase